MNEKKILYFTVDVQGVIDYARHRYWYEDAKTNAVDTLRCFIGIEPIQITKILDGDATINRDKFYVEIPDEEFKRELAEFQAAKKRYEHDGDMYIGGVPVATELIDRYTQHVVKRLRETMRNTKHGIMFDVKDIDELMGLECERQELHDEILEYAGYPRDDRSKDACAFRNALDRYVDSVAGTICEAPLCDMSPDEIERGKIESERLVKMMDEDSERKFRVMRTLQYMDAGLI
jgi:hypothetical protein